MDSFIGRKGVFLPKVIIMNKDGEIVETTNRTKLPKIDKIKKTELLNYKLFENDMPITNPQDLSAELEKLYKKSKISRNTSI